MKYAKLTKPTLILLALIASSSLRAADDPLSIVKDYMASWSSLSKKHHVSDTDISIAANLTASHFDSEVVYLDSTVGTPQQGIVVARDNVIKPFLTAFPNAEWKMVGQPKVDGNNVEFDWLFTGNNKGPYIIDATCPGKGDHLALKGHSKITVANGLITYQNDSYNDKDIPTQLSKSDSFCKKSKLKK